MTNEQVETISNGYDAYLEDVRRLIDHETANLLPTLTGLGLCDRLRYVLQTRGKRLRPTLVMLSTQSVGGQVAPVKKLALAVELLHGATLIHDDVLDQDNLRRNAPTVNAKWGVRDAVLVGDALASLSMSLTAKYGEEIVKIMSKTCLLLSDGEYLDVENAKKTLSENDYIETIRRKSASLFKAATQCGALAADAGPDEVDALADFGEAFGLAYQVRDDLEDVSALENVVPQDINEFRATLPLIHFCKSVKPNVREAFFEMVTAVHSQSSAEKATLIYELHRSLESAGSFRYCTDRINQYVDSAVASLEPLRETVYKGYLVQMANSLRLK
jgi:geranylgeranyl pyrophosphate synthase